MYKKLDMSKRLYFGFSITFHDPAIAIVNDKGELLFAEATERYMQNKRAINCLPDDINLIEKLLNCYSELDNEYIIAFTWNKISMKLMPWAYKLFEKLVRQPDKKSFLVMCMKGMHSNYILTGENLRFRVFDSINPNAKLKKKYYRHHDTHIIGACYGSSFNDALCAVIDGFGETSSTKYFLYKDNKINVIKNIPRSKASLGLFYTDLCSICGFDPIKGEEWKVMGLSPYGKLDQNIYDIFNELISVKNCTLSFGRNHKKAMERLFTYKRKPNESAITMADIAYTGQEFFSDIMTKLLTGLYEIGGSENLVLTGGCALNSSYNGKILGKTKFKNLYIPSAPADDGNAIGAAYLAFLEDHPDFKFPEQIVTPYLGHEARKEKISHLINLGGMKDILRPGEDICKRTAELLADGKIVGWFQGRAEMGPRALGNRSILADPRNADVKERINDKVKFREEYRPFAPSILHEFGPEYFENYQESPYMERTLKFKKEVYGKVPGVVHVDGTGRLQTVKKEWNEKYYQLIFEFYKITNVPILLNTSFNVMGKPIVHSVEDAIAVFYSSGLDVLAIEDKLFTK
jgi:carbamoyltransferase